MNSVKIIPVLVVAIAMLTGAVAYLYVRLDTLSQTLTSRDATSKQTAPQITDSNTPQEIPEELKPDTVKNDLISINSEGFAPSGMQVYYRQKLELAIVNDDVTAHSFNIDELDIKTGPIEPGKTMPVSIDNLPSNSVTYEYYSDIGNDKKNGKYSGMLMILNK